MQNTTARTTVLPGSVETAGRTKSSSTSPRTTWFRTQGNKHFEHSLASVEKRRLPLKERILATLGRYVLAKTSEYSEQTQTLWRWHVQAQAALAQNAHLSPTARRHAVMRLGEAAEALKRAKRYTR